MQAIGDQGLAVVDGGAAGLPDGAGQVAGGVKGGLCAQFGAEAFGQTVQQQGVANSTSKCNSRLKIRLLSEVRQKPPVAV